VVAYKVICFPLCGSVRVVSDELPLLPSGTAEEVITTGADGALRQQFSGIIVKYFLCPQSAIFQFLVNIIGVLIPRFSIFID